MLDLQASLDVVVPGTPVSELDGKAITDKVCEICGWHNRNFPGSQPVSLTIENLTRLKRAHYVACEKSDGVRYLFFCASGSVFLIDRRNTVIRLNMHMPGDHNGTQQLTLLDGELVTDMVKDSDGNMKKTTRFLIYDAMRIGLDETVAQNNLMERLRKAYTDVLMPRRQWEADNPELVKQEKDRNDYLELYIKDFFGELFF